MEEFKVASFNVKDKGPFESNEDNQKRAEVLANYILRENIAAMGTQEATKKYLSYLSTNLPDQYIIAGNYRQKVIPFYNEANAIITPNQVTRIETIQLPHRPKGLFFIDPLKSLLDVHKRTATWVLMNMPEIGHVIIIDIHFTYLRENPNNDLKLTRFNGKMSPIVDQQFTDTLVLQKYLRALYPEYPIVIMGDFNAPIFYKSFEEYITASKKIGMNYVPNIEKTQRTNEAPIDHILYTDNLELKDFSVGDSELRETSDHEVLTATFRRK